MFYRDGIHLYTYLQDEGISLQRRFPSLLTDSHPLMTHDTYPTDEPAVVTCGLPYANGDLHIGHFRTYVGGDMYARALGTLGQQTAFVCGSDMHGTPVAVDAKQNDEDPETLALDYYREHKALFPEFNVEFDEYGHTRQPTNIETTTQIVQTLEERGYIDEREATVAYDPEADQTLPDRYVEGTCPYCGSKARGDECDEGCGRHLEPGEIENPVSTITGNEAEYREQTHKFFRLSDLQEYLQAFIERLEGTDNAKYQPRDGFSVNWKIGVSPGISIGASTTLESCQTVRIGSFCTCGLMLTSNTSRRLSSTQNALGLLSTTGTQRGRMTARLSTSSVATSSNTTPFSGPQCSTQRTTTSRVQC